MAFRGLADKKTRGVRFSKRLRPERELLNMYAPEDTFADAVNTVKECLRKRLVTPEAMDNRGTTMREWCQDLPKMLEGFLAQ
jgi:hypothetical protein